MKVMGLIGLGEKGYAFAQALQKRKVKILGFDLIDSNRLRAANNHIVTTSSISGVVMHLPKRKVISLVLNSADEYGKVLPRLNELLNADDIIIDCENKVEESNYKSLIKSEICVLSAQILNDRLIFGSGTDLNEKEKEALEYCEFLV